jgi:hypothetical protein
MLKQCPQLSLIQPQSCWMSPGRDLMVFVPKQGLENGLGVEFKFFSWGREESVYACYNHINIFGYTKISVAYARSRYYRCMEAFRSIMFQVGLNKLYRMRNKERNIFYFYKDPRRNWIFIVQSNSLIGGAVLVSYSSSGMTEVTEVIVDPRYLEDCVKIGEDTAFELCPNLFEIIS